MELVVLGSGTVAPSAHRSSPAYWISSASTRLLLDCGSGALQRAATFGIEWWRVHHVVLTHFHPDHWSDLPTLLMALRWGIEPARSEPLTLWGPTGLRGRLIHLAGAMGGWVLDPGYPLTIRELPAGPTEALETGFTIEAHPTPHANPSHAYRLSDGTRHLVYTGDTGPSDALADWARPCDLLLCECSLPDERAVDIHLTPTQAGALARRAAAGRLVLTHFYPPMDGATAATVAARTFGGDVVAAADGDRFTV